MIKKHSHRLPYCISIFNWKCSLCQNHYDKNYARYYFSLCDFNMCKECHSKKKYIKNKEFQNGIKPSNPDIKNPIITS